MSYIWDLLSHNVKREIRSTLDCIKRKYGPGPGTTGYKGNSLNKDTVAQIYKDVKVKCK